MISVRRRHACHTSPPRRRRRFIMPPDAAASARYARLLMLMLRHFTPPLIMRLRRRCCFFDAYDAATVTAADFSGRPDAARSPVPAEPPPTPRLIRCFIDAPSLRC